jgi:hypothetical protein
MLDINRILDDYHLLRAFTGLNREAFDELCLSFTIALHKATAATEKARKRAPGGGRSARLQRVEDKLFFILFYFKCYPTFDVAGILFDLHRSRAHRWMLRLQPLLETALDKKMVLPERQINSIEEFITRFPGVPQVSIDETKRPLLPPKDPSLQRSDYSGKKKCHTHKQLVRTDENKQAMWLSRAREGLLEDRKALGITK